MLALTIDLAIYKLLTGYPLDNQGKPVLDENRVPKNRLRFGPPFQSRYSPLPGATGDAALPNRWPSHGIRIPMTRGDATMKSYLNRNSSSSGRLFDQGFQENAFRQIPVFDENNEGRDFKSIWPCVTFRNTAESMNLNTFIYSDDFSELIGNPVNITNRKGTVIETGTDKRQRRQHPNSYDLTYMIRSYSKNRIENGLICDAIKYLMPQRFGLEIEFADGSTHVCDVMMDSIVNLDAAGNEIPMALAGDEQRYYSRGYTYRVEGYADNTVNEFGTDDVYATNVITQRILEIADVQNNLKYQLEENSEELFPIEEPE